MDLPGSQHTPTLAVTSSGSSDSAALFLSPDGHTDEWRSLLLPQDPPPLLLHDLITLHPGSYSLPAWARDLA